MADIVWAVGEAMGNAIEHGRDEFFVVEGVCDDRALQVAVHDRGAGFDVGGRVSVASESLGERGLGIYLMRALTDEAQFQWRPDGGMTVTLKKHHAQV